VFAIWEGTYEKYEQYYYKYPKKTNILRICTEFYYDKHPREGVSLMQNSPEDSKSLSKEQRLDRGAIATRIHA
jgi:hypothetical protein